MEYYERFSDVEIQDKLASSGAVLIRGPKGCGKTATARQVSASVLDVDRDQSVSELIDVDPSRLLMGARPRLIDEWQNAPTLWNLVRHAVDDSNQKGEFILTGSANTNDDIRMHSGAGRFTVIDMRPFSLAESKLSTKEVSLASLFSKTDKDNQSLVAGNRVADIEEVATWILRGGWPTLLNASNSSAQQINEAYIDLLAQIDMSRVSNVRRDPIKVQALLKSISRNIATLTDMETIVRDCNSNVNSLSKPTVYDFYNALKQLMIVEDVPAFNVHVRSSATLRKTPKRHFVDPSLAVACLGLDINALLDNIKFLGYLFESLVVRDLRIYANTFGAKVFHYHDSQNREVDAIVQKRNGDWAAFEIKLGRGKIDEAVNSLIRFHDNLDLSKTDAPKSLNVIVSSGESYTRPDGINIVSIGSLTA